MTYAGSLLGTVIGSQGASKFALCRIWLPLHCDKMDGLYYNLHVQDGQREAVGREKE